MAKGLTGNVPILVIPRGQEAQALAPLSLSVLGMTEAQAQTFENWGIRSIGALAALPEDALISRLGQDGKRLLQLAQGKRPHLLEPADLPFILEEQVELDFPLDDLEALLFGLSPMLEQLILRAQSRMYALAKITVTLELEGGTSHSRIVAPRVATNEKSLWLKLLHLDLENHPPRHSIVAVQLHGIPGMTNKVQLGLFSPQLPESGKLDITLARLSAIVGDGNVGKPVLDDTHRINNFHIETFSLTHSESPQKREEPYLYLRLLRPAEKAHVEVLHGKPKEVHFRSRRYIADRVYGPWLQGGEWWNDGIWGNEQWDMIARANDSSFLACRLMRDFIQNEWSIAGLYD